jgi:hypothetical protein
VAGILAAGRSYRDRLNAADALLEHECVHGDAFSWSSLELCERYLLGVADDRLIAGLALSGSFMTKRGTVPVVFLSPGERVSSRSRSSRLRSTRVVKLRDWLV